MPNACRSGATVHTSEGEKSDGNSPAVCLLVESNSVICTPGIRTVAPSLRISARQVQLTPLQ